MYPTMLSEWNLCNNGAFLVSIPIWMLYQYMLWSNSCTGSIRHYLSIRILSVIEFLTSHVRSLNPLRATFLRVRRWSQSYNEQYWWVIMLAKLDCLFVTRNQKLWSFYTTELENDALKAIPYSNLNRNQEESNFWS